MTIVAHNRKKSYTGHAYAHRGGEKDQAVYVSMSFFIHVSLVLCLIDAVSTSMLR